MTPRESYVRAKIDHYCERIEECCSAARYPAARRLLDVVYTLDPADPYYLELRNRVDERFSELLRHPAAGLNFSTGAGMNGFATGIGTQNGNGNGHGSSEGNGQGNGNGNGYGGNGGNSQGNGNGYSGNGGNNQGNGNGNGHASHLTHPDKLAVVVDQDERLLAHLATEMPRHGYRLAGAASFEEATEILSLVSPDIVVSEVNFDVGSRGFDLFLWLRTHNVLAQTPFIFQATRIDSDVLLAGKRFGVDDFLLKPVDGAVLAASATHAIHQRRPLPVSA